MFFCAKLFAQKIHVLLVVNVATIALCVSVNFARTFFCMRLVDDGLHVAVFISVAVSYARTIAGDAQRHFFPA